MNRISRAAVVAALASAVALGVTVPADAAAGGKAGHHKVHTAKGAKADKSTKGGKGAKADRAERELARAERKLAAEITRKDRYLARVLERDGVARLEDTLETALRANVEADRLELTGLRTAAADVTTRQDLGPVAAEVHGLRPERYNTVINQMRLAQQLLTASAGDLETTAVLDAVVADLVTFTASTPRADLQAAQTALTSAGEALEETEETETGETETGETETGETETGETETGETETPVEPAPAA